MADLFPRPATPGDQYYRLTALYAGPQLLMGIFSFIIGAVGSNRVENVETLVILTAWIITIGILGLAGLAFHTLTGPSEQPMRPLQQDPGLKFFKAYIVLMVIGAVLAFASIVHASVIVNHCCYGLFSALYAIVFGLLYLAVDFASIKKAKSVVKAAASRMTGSFSDDVLHTFHVDTLKPGNV